MKKKFVVIITIILIILVSIFFINKYNIEKKEQEKLINEQKQLQNIKSHYNKFVSTKKEAILYKKVENEFIEHGKIAQDVFLQLEDENITLDTKYFLINGLDLYIKYSDVEVNEEQEISDRYKNYILFNENIKTKNITNFYNEDNKFLYTINESFEFKVIVKDKDRYGIEYNNQLLYIKHEDIEKTYESKNTDQKNKSKIKTLTYHFLYNPENTKCDQSICQSLSQFESHLKYIRENEYFTLKLNELELYLDGKIQIPEKSIVLTIDDGTTFDLGAIELLEKYKSNATLFVITSWVYTDNLNSKYLDLESHTNNMHNQYECPGYGNQGGGILCLPEETVLEDLKISQEKIGGSKYFAYPFFDFSDRAISLLKQAGFKMAFIGQYDTDGDSYPNKTDKYKVRRKTIFSDTSIEEFISYLN